MKGGKFGNLVMRVVSEDCVCAANKLLCFHCALWTSTQWHFQFSQLKLLWQTPQDSTVKVHINSLTLGNQLTMHNPVGGKMGFVWVFSHLKRRLKPWKVWTPLRIHIVYSLSDQNKAYRDQSVVDGFCTWSRRWPMRKWHELNVNQTRL